MILLACLHSVSVKGQEADTAACSHWGYEAEVQAGRVLVLDRFQKSYMRHMSDYSAALKINHVSLPSDSDAYAHDYGYPTFSVALKYSKNDRASMYRPLDYPSGNITLADYTTHLGNSCALFGSFSVPLLRNRRWEIDVTGNLGLAYSDRKYSKIHNVDNDMVGSHMLFYAGGGASATYRFAHQWGLKAGIDYWHISNGSTSQPNRSVNVLGPTLGVVYYPYYQKLLDECNTYVPETFPKYWYFNLKAGVGVRRCLEDWDYYQYKIDMSDPDYRKEDFNRYMCFSFQGDIMYRYARIAAIGAGVDVMYGSYYKHLRWIDEVQDKRCPHSPWSVALAAKHTLFYGNVSLALGLGVYLFREMGDFSNRHDLPFYNRIGVHYTMPRLADLTVGVEVKAHLSKADFTEFVVSWPIRL